MKRKRPKEDEKEKQPPKKRPKFAIVQPPERPESSTVKKNPENVSKDYDTSTIDRDLNEIKDQIILGICRTYSKHIKPHLEKLLQDRIKLQRVQCEALKTKIADFFAQIHSSIFPSFSVDSTTTILSLAGGYSQFNSQRYVNVCKPISKFTQHLWPGPPENQTLCWEEIKFSREMWDFLSEKHARMQTLLDASNYSACVNFIEEIIEEIKLRLTTYRASIEKILIGYELIP